MTDNQHPSAIRRRLVNVRTFIRGGYLALTEPAEVIRGAKVIGTWYPAAGAGEDAGVPDAERTPVPAARVRAMTQAERDRVLRRVQKTGGS